MGIDWIDDTLRKAEQIPVLQGFAHDLRMIYEVWRLPTIDSGPMKTQADILEDLYHQLDGLRNDFNDNLVSLSQTWAGAEADTYLGTIPTAFQVEHDMEPPNNSVSMKVWANLNATQASLDYNHAAHLKGKANIDHMNDLHNQLDFQFKLAIGTLAAMIVVALIPGPDIVDAGPSEVVESGEVGTAVATANEINSARVAVQTIDIVKQASEIADAAWQAWDVTQFINKVRLVGGILLLVDAGIAITDIVIYLDNQGNSASSPLPAPTPHPVPFGGTVTSVPDCGPNPVTPVPDKDLQALKDALSKAGIPVDNEVALKLLLKKFGFNINQIVTYIQGLQSTFPTANLNDIVALKAFYSLPDADIACILQKGYGPPNFDLNGTLSKLATFKAAMRKMWNQLLEHLSPEDLNGAWRELHNCVTNASANAHVGEMNDADRSLQQLVNAINNKLASKSPTDPATTQALENMKNLLMSLRAKLAQIVGGATEPDPAAVSPIVNDLTAIFGC